MSGPLISFGSRPSPQPTPSFWNDPATKRRLGKTELPSRLEPRGRVSRPEAPCVDPDRDTEDLRRRRSRSRARAPPWPGSTPVRGRAPCAGYGASRSTCRTRAFPAFPAGRAGRRHRAGCRARSNGRPSSVNWLVWKTLCPWTAAIHDSGPTWMPRPAARRASESASSSIAHVLPSPATNSLE